MDCVFVQIINEEFYTTILERYREKFGLTAHFLNMPRRSEKDLSWKKNYNKSLDTDIVGQKFVKNY